MTLKFDLSDVCLEGNFLDELMNIPENLLNAIKRTLGIIEEQTDIEKVM